METKKLTGYASIDKPHYKYYRKEPVRAISVNTTIYDMVFSANAGNMDADALEYMGTNWTYQVLKQKVDQMADSFYKAGLKVGDTVLIGMSNCFEAVVLLLALNRIGIVSKWFDLRASCKDIAYYANSSNCRYMVVFDLLLPKIMEILSETIIEKVLVVTPVDSLPFPIQLAYRAKCRIEGKKHSIPDDKRYERMPAFLKKGSTSPSLPCVPFDKSRPSIMIQSSGTTGKPRIIVHSDYSATSCVHALAYCDIPVEPGKKLLNLLPPWIAYALGEAILYPLTLGTKVVLSPTFEPHEIMNYIGRFTLAFAAPFCYRYLYSHINELSDKQKQALYRTECFISGGNKMTVEENADFENTFKTRMLNGYGNNEGWGCLTVNCLNENRYGTVGIPKYGETVICYDNETQSELPYGQLGEVCALAETAFLYYESNEAETNSVKRIHADGNVWLHTGDLGSIDEDGFLTLSGRIRRVIIRRGFKISAYTIEDKICECPSVKECVVVAVPDQQEEHVPLAYVTLKQDMPEAMAQQEIRTKCMRELKEYEVPKYIVILRELPYTPNNKYDFKKLESLGTAYVDHHQPL